MRMPWKSARVGMAENTAKMRKNHNRLTIKQMSSVVYSMHKSCSSLTTVLQFFHLLFDCSSTVVKRHQHLSATTEKLKFCSDKTVLLFRKEHFLGDFLLLARFAISISFVFPNKTELTNCHQPIRLRPSLSSVPVPSEVILAKMYTYKSVLCLFFRVLCKKHIE